jgi:hypothetical protein
MVIWFIRSYSVIPYDEGLVCLLIWSNWKYVVKIRQANMDI